MAYLTISIEFANPNVTFGHIKDSRVSYTTKNVAYPNNFVLYPGRWIGDNSRGTFNAIPNVLLEDSLGDLTIDLGIHYFSSLDNKQFSFDIVDDGTYKFLTRNQNLTGRVLITYHTEASRSGDVKYEIAMLDLYSATYDNGVVKFECDTVSNWNDNPDGETSVYGSVKNAKLEKFDPENVLLWPIPISLLDVYDGRFQNNNFAFGTNYKKTSETLCRIRLDLKEGFTPEFDLIKQYVNKFIKIECVDGKGVGKKYSGKLTRIILPLQSTMYYALEFPFNLSSLPEIEELSEDNFILSHDSSSSFKLISDYVVYSVGDISLSDIESLSFTNSDGIQISIPTNSVILENGKLKIPNDYELNYKAEIPLTLTDFTSTSTSTVANLFDGDAAITNQISVDQANAILNDYNTDTFVGTLINNSYGVGSYCVFTFEIGDSEANLSLYKNASKYVLNGKIELDPAGSLQNVQMQYEWFNKIGDNAPFEFNSSNVEIKYPIKTFTISDTKWYTLNRYSINETYTGTVSGGENYLKDKIELSLTEDSDEVKKIGLFFNVNANAISKIRLYELNICAEFAYKFNSSSELIISLKDTHSGASISDISEIIAAEYAKQTGQITVCPILGAASGIIIGTNRRKTLQELISETPCSFVEKVSSDIVNCDFYYTRFLRSYYTIASTSFDLVDLPLIEIKSVSVNDEWYNTINITSGDAFYNLGKINDPLVDTNTAWVVASNADYNSRAAESFQNNGVIKSIDKALRYVSDPNTLLSIPSDRVSAYWRFVKTYTCKCLAPLSVDILYKLYSALDNSVIIRTSHPALFDNAVVTMRINKMHINFQRQEVDLECDIFDIQWNSEQIDFNLFFDSPFINYADKIQDNLSNGNDGDWYVGIL